MTWLFWVLLFTGICTSAPANLNVQHGLESVVQRQPTGSTRPLKGKFLHITDIHFDPFYKPGTKHGHRSACHHGHGRQETGRYGAPTTRCDSPEELVNATFKWIEENVKDEIDFVIFTGDAVRHDNDPKIPRSSKLVLDINTFVARKMAETFRLHRSDPSQNPLDEYVVPIIPNIGNNDFTPHNIFLTGPNKWTKNFLDIWKSFIPEAQEHSFARGAWFWTEVIPNKLAVISLNTMYFFNANAASFGCNIKTEAGYEHMEWLRIQLQFMRERGMKVFMIGHVPPARMKHKHVWDESCYQKYTLWLRQYRDVIIANFYGHMNVDHFIFHDLQDSIYKLDTETDDWSVEYDHVRLGGSSNETVHALAKKGYLKSLHTAWNHLPTPPPGITYDTLGDFADGKREKNSQIDDFLVAVGGPFAERFAVSLVSPSIVPNFLPSIRVLEYNITGLDNDHPAVGLPQGHLATEKDLKHQNSFWKRKDPSTVSEFGHDFEEDDDDGAEQEVDTDMKKRKKHGKNKKKNKKGKKKHGKKPKKMKPVRPNFPVPLPPSRTAPPGPAYSPQTFSLLSWTQYYANITLLNELDQKGRGPVLERSPQTEKLDGFEYTVEYSTNSSDVYNMSDLTVKQWLGLAKAMSSPKVENQADSNSFGNENVFRLASAGLQRFLGFNVENDDDSDESFSALGKGRHRLRDNDLWYEFIRRAFVYSRSDSDLEKEFG